MFAADDGVNGRELWSSDGTAPGTTFFDLVSGPDSSAPQNLRTHGGTVFFSAHEMATGRELWKSNATLAGTQRVADIHPGAGNSDPGPVSMGEGGLLYLSANDGTTGAELWRTDGTAAGTMLVADVLGGAQGSSPSEFHSFLGATYFTALRPTGHPQFPPGTLRRSLYRTDGSAGGTTLAGAIDSDFHPFVSEVTHLASWASNLYFITSPFPGSFQLQRWNGDPGTSPLSPAVVDAYPVFNTTLQPFVLTAHGLVTVNASSLVKFPYVDPIPAPELLNPGPGAIDVDSPTEMIWAYASRLFFRSASSTMGEELGQADVSVPGASLSGDLNTTPSWDNTPSAEIQRIAAFRSRALITTAGHLRNSELWISDGTPSGTVLLDSSPAGNPLTQPVSLGSVAVMFRRNISTGVQQLVTTDGSSTTDGPLFQTTQYEPYTARLGSRCYFNGQTADEGEEIWRTDGTITARMTNLAPGNGFSRVLDLKVAGPWLYFTTSLIAGDALMRMDDGGTVEAISLPFIGAPRIVGTAGTRLIIERFGDLYSIGAGPGDLVHLNPGSPLSTNSFVPAIQRNGILHFVGNDFGTYGQEPWKTDGTAAGTSLLKDLVAGNNGSQPALLAPGASRHYFSATDGTDVGLWRSDGSEIGTTLVTQAFAPSEITTDGDTAWIAGFDPMRGNELWHSHGSALDTVAYDIESGPGSSFPSLLTVVRTWRGPTLFFAAVTPGHDLEPWVMPPLQPSAYALWQAANGNLGAPDADTDGDGLSNEIEWALGLPAGEGTGAPIEIGLGGALPTATFKALSPIPAGVTYTIEKSTDLLTWLPVWQLTSSGASVIAPHGPGGVTLTGPLPSPKPGYQCWTATLPGGVTAFVRISLGVEY